MYHIYTESFTIRKVQRMLVCIAKSTWQPKHCIYYIVHSQKMTGVADFGRMLKLKDSYSHRCHRANCVNPRHCHWEPQPANIERSTRRGKGPKAYVGISHLVLPDGAIILLCNHEPCCLTARPLRSWCDPVVVRPPVNVFLLMFLSSITVTAVPNHTRSIPERNTFNFELEGVTLKALD